MSFSTEKIRSLLSTSSPAPSPNPPLVPPPLPPSASSATPGHPTSALPSAVAPASPPTIPPHLSAAVDALLRTYELDADFSALDQVDMCVEAALQCQRQGSMRKFGFFLIQAAGLYQELDKHEACTHILQAIQPLYRLHPVCVDVTEAEEAATAREAKRLLAMAPERRAERGVTEQRWLTLQRSLLEHLIYTAHKNNSQQPSDHLHLPSCPSPSLAADDALPRCCVQMRCCRAAVCCTCCLCCTGTWTWRTRRL